MVIYDSAVYIVQRRSTQSSLHSNPTSQIEVERASSSIIKMATTTQTKTALKIVFGAMTLGKEGTYLPIYSSPNLHLHFDALAPNQIGTVSNAPYRR